MGYYFRGVPRDIALCLMDKYRLNVFIETGTLVGYTARWASHHFFQVFTIEKHDEYYQKATTCLADCPNIVCIKNISVYALEQLRQDLDGLFCPLFWLDAHWSQEAHYGRPQKETDVIEEINNINSWQSRHAIIVDDVHKFSTPRWPSRESVISALQNNGKRIVNEIFDVYVAFPNEDYHDMSGGHLYADESIDVATSAIV